ncbi:MAG: peptidylprolyl isomerase [Dehalococcoidales bacterium]
MSQTRKKRADKGTVASAQNPNLQTGSGRGKWAGIIIAAVVIAIMAATIGFFSYQQYIAPFRRPVVVVDDVSIRMDYFLTRLRLSGADPLDMLNQLSREQVIKLVAPQYGIEVTPEDIDQTLRTTFRGESETISESEFNEWYRQLLNERGLSDAEFRELVSIGLLSSRLQEYLAERVPTVAPQRHLYIIALEEYEEALEVRARWEAGENFSELAREVSVDESTREQGGELGWFPPGGVLAPNLEFEAFSLNTGNVSQPIALMGEEVTPEGETVPAIMGYYITLVAEEAVRELDEASLQVVRGNALDDWFSKERGSHKIQYHGFKNGFDSETYAWINWQLAKSQPSSSG